MNKVSLKSDEVHIEISGWDKIWSFKGLIIISRKSITKVYSYDEKAKIKPPCWRWPGTAIPKIIIAGTYYGKGRREFWNFRFKKQAIVFDLQGAEYSRIVINVEDPESLLKQLNNDAV